MHATVAYLTLAYMLHGRSLPSLHQDTTGAFLSPIAPNLRPWRAEPNTGLRLGNLHLPVAQSKGGHRGPHRAEAAAVRGMKNLYSWSEFLVKHVENHGPENDIGEGESDVDSSADRILPAKVANSTTRLCRCFRDREALIAARELV